VAIDNGANDEAPSRLARRLGTFDAVVIGLASMVGAGIFAAIGPAAEVAGGGLLLGLGAAALVAFCNATSSAQLAARSPASGGTYVYGRERLGELWGFLAGWGFAVGKTASCAAIALTFASYVGIGRAERPLAIGAVAALTAINLLGVRKTAWATRIIVGVVILALATVIVASFAGGHARFDRIGSLSSGGVHGILQAGGLLFFAFAGYARIATLGEEVVAPQRTIPRAIPIALGITLALYATVAAAVLVVVGPDRLATASAPLATAVRAGSLDWLAPAVRIGAAVATLGVLISLLAGISRTVFAMASERDLPRWLGAVHPHHQVPHRAEITVGALVIAVVLLVDVRGAIGFSSFAVLVYYGITNAAAWTLSRHERRWPRVLTAVGLLGCLTLAVNLPLESIIGGVVLLMVGAALRFAASQRRALNPK
jgi:basic amino acid/polyamine antiporter, APA family